MYFFFKSRNNITNMPKTKKVYYDSDSEDEAPKAKRKAKKKKDPNAPKRPTSGYFYFAAEVNYIYMLQKDQHLDISTLLLR